MSRLITVAVVQCSSRSCWAGSAAQELWCFSRVSVKPSNKPRSLFQGHNAPTKAFFSLPRVLLKVLLSPRSSCSLRSLCGSFGSADAPRLPAGFSSGWVLQGPSPTTSGAVAGAERRAVCSGRWDAVISTKPNSDPLPSSSFNEVLLKPLRPPSASNNFWGGNFPARFLLVSCVLFPQVFFSRCAFSLE